MIHQVCGPTLDPADIHRDLPAHQAEMIARCPYLGPCVQHGHSVWSAYSAEPGDQPGLLNLLVDYAEEVRHARRHFGPLVCRNVALLGPADTKAAQELMEVPVWLARNLYAPVQIIVDRFWIGIGRLANRGSSTMPNVPVSYFMIRCGIVHRDRIIVSDHAYPDLTALRRDSTIDDHDVLSAVTGRLGASPADEWINLQTVFPVAASSTYGSHCAGSFTFV